MISSIYAHRHRGDFLRAVVSAILFCGAITVLPRPTSAAVLSGSLRSTLYSQQSRAGAADYERRIDADGAIIPDAQRSPLETRTRLHESLRLSVAGLRLSGLSLHTSVTGANVLTDQSIGDTRFRFYRGYAQYASPRGSRLGYDLRAGRQWVSGGVGTGIVDGLAASVRPTPCSELTGYAGTLGIDRLATTDRFWSLDSWDDSRAYGGRVRVQRALGPVQPHLAVSWGRRDRTPHKELVRDEERLGVHGELALSPRAAGGRAIASGLRLYGDWRRDLVFNQDLNVAGGIELRAPGVAFLGQRRDPRVRVEYQQRRPALRSTSDFASFTITPVNELRAGVGSALWGAVRLDLDASLISFDGDEDDTGLSAVLSGHGLSLGYRFHDGWGGDLSSVVLSGHRRIGEKLSIDANVDLSQYSYGGVENDPNVKEIDDGAVAGLIALGYDLLPRLTLTGQAEILENATYNHDVRLLGMVHWRFRTAL